MQVLLNSNSLESYRQFLAIKRLPTWTIRGHVAEFPDEYAELITGDKQQAGFSNWEPSSFLFDWLCASVAMRCSPTADWARRSSCWSSLRPRNSNLPNGIAVS